MKEQPKNVYRHLSPHYIEIDEVISEGTHF